jgi:hypothetical protein
MTASMDDYLGCVVWSAFTDKIAAKLFHKDHGIRTLVVKSEYGNSFVSDMPVLGLFNYRKFL